MCLEEAFTYRGAPVAPFVLNGVEGAATMLVDLVCDTCDGAVDRYFGRIGGNLRMTGGVAAAMTIVKAMAIAVKKAKVLMMSFSAELSKVASAFPNQYIPRLI